MNKLNFNTYVIDLLKDYDIRYTFNVNDLVDYKNFDCNPLIDKHFLKSFSESFPLSPLPNTHPITIERVDKILKNETIATKSSETHKYLIRQREKTPTINLWLDRGNLQRIDPV